VSVVQFRPWPPDNEELARVIIVSRNHGFSEAKDHGFLHGATNCGSASWQPLKAIRRCCRVSFSALAISPLSRRVERLATLRISVDPTSELDVIGQAGKADCVGENVCH
jgi:hypothetical protein